MIRWSFLRLAIVVSFILYFIIGTYHANSYSNIYWAQLEDRAVDEARHGDDYLIRKQRFVKEAGTVTAKDGRTYPRSCCGEGDVYEADDFEVSPDGQTVAILTCNDPRDCELFPGRPPRAPGTKFTIPKFDTELVNHDPVNNTGHGWIWINRDGVTIYCYAPPAAF